MDPTPARQALDEVPSLARLDAAGVPVLTPVRVADPAAAVDAARSLGLPLVRKLEADGVRLARVRHDLRDTQRMEMVGHARRLIYQVASG